MKSPVEEIEALVARVGKHPVYGYAHCLRVHALAVDLARSEGTSYDAEILHVSALLHDIGLYKAYALREPPDHAKRSAVVARRVLQDLDFPSQAGQAVIEAIDHHPRPGRPRRRRRVGPPQRRCRPRLPGRHWGLTRARYGRHRGRRT